MIFDKFWFERFQRILITLLNMPLLGQLLRRAMWVPDLWRPVTCITPDAVHVWIGFRRRRAILYSNNQYAEGLHRSFSWLWAMVHWWDMTIANRWAPALNLGFDIFDIQPDDTEARYCVIRTDGPTTNYRDSYLYTGTSLGSVYRSLLAFDFASLAGVTEVLECSIFLWQYLANGTQTVQFHRCRRNFVDTQATWNIWATGQNWQTAGAAGANDIETDTVNASVSITNANQMWEFDFSTGTGGKEASLERLADMLPSGEWPNNGWRMYQTSEPGTGNNVHHFRSPGGTTPGERPRMVMEYVLPLVMKGTARITWGGTATPESVLPSIYASDVPKTRFKAK